MPLDTRADDGEEEDAPSDSDGEDETPPTPDTPATLVLLDAMCRVALRTDRWTHHLSALNTLILFEGSEEDWPDPPSEVSFSDALADELAAAHHERRNAPPTHAFESPGVGRAARLLVRTWRSARFVDGFAREGARLQHVCALLVKEVGTYLTRAFNERERHKRDRDNRRVADTQYVQEHSYREDVDEDGLTRQVPGAYDALHDRFPGDTAGAVAAYFDGLTLVHQVYHDETQKRLQMRLLYCSHMQGMSLYCAHGNPELLRRLETLGVRLADMHLLIDLTRTLRALGVLRFPLGPSQDTTNDDGVVDPNRALSPGPVNAAHDLVLAEIASREEMRSNPQHHWTGFGGAAACREAPKHCEELYSSLYTLQTSRIVVAEGRWAKDSAIYLALQVIARFQGYSLKPVVEPVAGTRRTTLSGLRIEDEILPETVRYFKRDSHTLGAVDQLRVISGVLTPVFDATAQAAFCAPLITRLHDVVAQRRRIHPRIDAAAAWNCVGLVADALLEFHKAKWTAHHADHGEFYRSLWNELNAILRCAGIEPLPGRLLYEARPEACADLMKRLKYVKSHAKTLINAAFHGDHQQSTREVLLCPEQGSGVDLRLDNTWGDVARCGPQCIRGLELGGVSVAALAYLCPNPRFIRLNTQNGGMGALISVLRYARLHIAALERGEAVAPLGEAAGGASLAALSARFATWSRAPSSTFAGPRAPTARPPMCSGCATSARACPSAASGRSCARHSSGARCWTRCASCTTTSTARARGRSGS